jgi:hypothetical protein
MVRRPHWLVGLLMGLMLPASIFQDTALQHSPLSIAAASPAFFLLAMVWILRLSGNPVDSLLRIKLHRLIVVVVFVYLFLNIYFGLQFGMVAYGENLFVKGVKAGILFATLVYAGWLFLQYSVPYASVWIQIGAFIAFLGLILDLTFHDALVRNWWLHYGVNDERFELAGFDDRPRGFSYESSTLGVTLMVSGLLAALSVSNRGGRLAWLVGTGVALLFCGSKAAFPVFFMSASLAIVLTSNRSIAVSLLILSSMLGIIASMNMELWWPIVERFFILPFILDIEESTSVATRLTMALSAVLNILKYPLGVGMTGYMSALTAEIDAAGELGSQLLNLPLNLGEVSKYLVQDTSFAIGAKSFLLDNAVVFGLPFVIAWFGGHWVLLKTFCKVKDTVGLTLLIGMFIPLTFYVPGVSLYILAIAYGYLIKRAKFRFQQITHGVQCERVQ